MDERKTKDNEEILKKIGIGIAVGAAGLAGGLIGFKLAESLYKVGRKDPYSDFTSYRAISHEIIKESSIELKLRKIEDQIKSDEWFGQVGAVLVLFSELEYFLELLILKNVGQVGQNDFGFTKKIGVLRGNRIITSMDYYLLKRLVPVRNNLVHGNHDIVSREDMMGCFVIVSDFFSRWS